MWARSSNFNIINQQSLQFNHLAVNHDVMALLLVQVHMRFAMIEFGAAPMIIFNPAMQALSLNLVELLL